MRAPTPQVRDTIFIFILLTAALAAPPSNTEHGEGSHGDESGFREYSASFPAAQIRDLSEVGS